MYSGQPSTSSSIQGTDTVHHPQQRHHSHNQIDVGMDSPSSSTSNQYMQMHSMSMNGMYNDHSNHDGYEDGRKQYEDDEVHHEQVDESSQHIEQQQQHHQIQPTVFAVPLPPSTSKVMKMHEDNYDMKKVLKTFWPLQKHKMETMSVKKLREASKNQVLPLARVKKIMKIDENVQKQMIAADAPLLLSVASEMFVEELTMRAWEVTEENKRKTLSKLDVATATAHHDHMDFLIDIVPRSGIMIKKEESSSPNGMNTNGGTSTTGATQIVQVVRQGDATAIGGVQLPPQFVLKGGKQISGIIGSDRPSTSSTNQEFAVHLDSGEVVQATQIGQPIKLPPQAMSQLGLTSTRIKCIDQSSSNRDIPPHRQLKTISSSSSKHLSSSQSPSIHSTPQSTV